MYYHEIWEINEQNFLSCKKFTSTNGKESEPTKISLIKTENKYYYSYNFKNEQITYSSDSLAENYIRLICNLDKFPQKIEYIRSKDTLYISLAGMAGGVYRNPIYKTVKY